MDSGIITTMASFGMFPVTGLAFTAVVTQTSNQKWDLADRPAVADAPFDPDISFLPDDAVRMTHRRVVLMAGLVNGFPH